jgi:hypothetical protein
MSESESATLQAVSVDADPEPPRLRVMFHLPGAGDSLIPARLAAARCSSSDC